MAEPKPPHSILEEMLSRTGVPADVREALAELSRALASEVEARHASEERYRRITEATADYVYSVRIADGKVLDTHHGEACEALTGYRSEEYADDPFLWYRMVHADDRALVQEQGRRVLAGEDVPPVEHRLIRKDGALRWVRNTVVLHRDSDGRLLSYDGLVADVTERREAEEALRASQARLQAAVESLPFDFFALDDQQRYILQNSVCRANWGDVIGKRTEDLGADDCSAATVALLQRNNRRALAGEVVDAEICLEINGERRYFQNIVTPTRDRGRIIGIQGVNIDLTERKRAEDERRRLEAQVQHAQKLESLGVLAGGIAHDFNNLLVGVLGNASLAGMNAPSDSPVSTLLKKVETAARRASELCNQLLAYSGRGTFVIESVNLNQLIEEMVNLTRVSIAKKADLRLNLADRPPTIRGDPTQLRQVVLNLVVNASEAIGDQEGAIILSTGVLEADRVLLASAVHEAGVPEGRYAYVEVQDTGAGMDASTRARLFDPFFTTKKIGRGLGLSAVLGIVRAHRGAISVESAPGKGTTFRVLLPSVMEAETIVPHPQPAIEDERWSGQGIVLLIDDEPAVLDIGQCILEPLGFTPLTARDGRAGVKVFNAHADEILAVFLDLTMPHLSGEEVLAQIRSRRPDVPVILMSGYSEHGMSGPITRDRIAGFLHKPFDVASFTNALRRALQPPDAA
jgi:two-component system cell cycle sensor histidine kinase/response regulator CckA